MRVEKPILSESTINYKGHGMIEKASASNSIGHVIAHENRHLQEFRNRAIYQGKEILSENISIKYEFRDGKLVAVAGEATATMKEKPKETSESSDYSQSNQPVIEIDRNSSDEENSVKRKLDVFLSRIDAALIKLDSKLNQSENNQDSRLRTGDENLARIRQKRVELESKKKEIQSKKNRLDAEKLNELTEQLLEGLSELAEQTSNLMKAIYGFKSGKQSGQNSDNNNELEVPDYSMLYTGMLLDTMIY